MKNSIDLLNQEIVSLKNKLLQKTQGAHCALCANYSFGAEYPDRIGLLRKGKKLEK